MMSDHNSSDLALQRQEMSIENVSLGLVPQGQKASDYDNSDPHSRRVLFNRRTLRGEWLIPAWIEANAGYLKEEGIDFEESFALYPKGSLIPDQPEKVLPSRKALWIKASSRGLVDELSKLLMSKGFTKDLVQAVCYCARYQARPTQKHLKEVKRIFKYLKVPLNMELCIQRLHALNITAVQNADPSRMPDTPKSILEGYSSLVININVERAQTSRYGFNYKQSVVLRLSLAIKQSLATPYNTHGQSTSHTLYHFIKEQVENGQTVVTATSIPFKCSIYESNKSRKLKNYRTKYSLTSELKLQDNAKDDKLVKDIRSQDSAKTE
ncbi:hypothetical protein Tco_1310832 [Tanacetum coccineum]